MDLQSPSRWQCIDFISDLHLQASEHQTFTAWADYLQHTSADAVFILGDLFEVWVGDDAITDESGFENQCAQVLFEASVRLDLFIMRGNRDFLMGPALMQASACTLLDDPTVLTFGGKRWLLTHGDALCLSDTAYMQFREVVRSNQWQKNFLSQALPERKEQARQLRLKSESIKRDNLVYADVDSAAANQLLQALQADTMVHGHTHRPGKHALDGGRERIVLSDWDLSAMPPRADVLRMRLSPDGRDQSPLVERIFPSHASRITAAKPAD